MLHGLSGCCLISLLLLDRRVAAGQAWPSYRIRLDDDAMRGALMKAYARAVRESLAAQATDKGPFACVDTHVDLEGA